MLITVFIIIALIISAIFHEYAHGWVAYKLGDYTAKDEGRLTLNPIAHLDPVGSILLPLLLVLMNSKFLIGWAKPVPYNPYNLKDQKYGELKVALGGPATNFALALFFGLLARFLPLANDLKQTLATFFFSGNNDALLSMINGSMITSVFILSVIICYVNLLLMIFNLIPFPPLDGSKVLSAFLPYNWQLKYQQLETFGLIILTFLLWFGFLNFIYPLVLFLFNLIIGVF